MNNKSATPYTKIEIIEEVQPRTQQNSRVAVIPKTVLVNGSEVMVVEDGVTIYPAANNDSIMTVSIELFADDVHIRRVPDGYTARARHQYALERDAHRIAEIGIAGKLRRLFRR